MNFRYKLMQFMSGRYGFDEFFYVLFAVSIILAVINTFVRLWIIQLIIYAIVIYAFFRFLSRNISARQRENTVVKTVLTKLRNFYQTYRQRKADTTHIYRKCPKCHCVLRLPRRKGKHKTVCPRCNREFTVRVASNPKWDIN